MTAQWYFGIIYLRQLLQEIQTINTQLKQQVIKKEYKFSKKHSEVFYYHIKSPDTDKCSNLFNTLNKRDCFYLIKFKNGIKIGISSYMSRRFREYNKPWCNEIKEIFLISGKNIKDPLNELELKLKREHCGKHKGSHEFISNYSMFYTMRLCKGELKKIFKKTYRKNFINY